MMPRCECDRPSKDHEPGQCPERAIGLFSRGQWLDVEPRALWLCGECSLSTDVEIKTVGQGTT